MQCQSLFSRKIKSKYFKMSAAEIFTSMQSIKQQRLIPACTAIQADYDLQNSLAGVLEKTFCDQQQRLQTHILMNYIVTVYFSTEVETRFSLIVASKVLYFPNRNCH